MFNDDHITYNCCGCGGCELVCPQKCIEIDRDEEGFYKPKIDRLKCISCGKCKNVCPIVNVSGNSIIDTFAMVSKNKEAYQRSSSGGIFSHVAEVILEKKGVVWGCGYLEGEAKHLFVESIHDLDNLRRSKYIQNDMRGCYLAVQKQLNDNKDVLFSGTPCQISGLKRFLGKEYNNLFTIDIVCHGVPSPLFFEKQCKYIEGKYRKKLDRYEFRLKNNNSKEYCYSYMFDDGSIVSDKYYKDPYFNEFYDMTSYNECCYNCPYSSENRPGDLTIGDFEWGKKYHTQLSDYQEVSCIIVNTQKGRRLLDELNNIELIPTKLEYIEEKNLNLLRPTPKPSYRSRIYKEIGESEYYKWVHSYYFSKRYIKHLALMKKVIELKKYIKNKHH